MTKNEKKSINAQEKKELSHTKKKAYIGYGMRLFLYILIFCVSLFASIIFSNQSLTFNDEKTINYSENSNLDYKVYLKENDFYDQEYLQKDMVYVASLIDRIDINFDYDFVSNQNLDLGFEYDIIGKLVITSKTGEKTYFEKEYKLVNDKINEIKNYNMHHFEETVKVDYDYYNSLANKFKSTYGVDSVSKFIVYLKLEKNSTNPTKFNINDNNIMYITIPLSEKSVEIAMDYKEINTENKVIQEATTIIDNSIFMIIAVVCCVIAITFMIKIMRFISLNITKKSLYDKYISKLLLEYDRLIVEVKSAPDLTKKIIKLEKFEELLDVRDNLKLPIMYYNVAKHQKCYFYIKHGEDIYLMTLKSVDLEEK